MQAQEALDLPTLTAYITYARQHIHPRLSDEAAEHLINGYVEMRRKGNFPGSSKKVYFKILFNSNYEILWKEDEEARFHRSSLLHQGS